VLLAPECVRRGLSAAREADDAIALLAGNRPVALPPRAGELDACRRLVAMRFLLWRAANGIAALPGTPTGAALDRIETDLRNAWLLRRSLVAHALPSVLGRIEATIGGRIDHLPAGALVRMMVRALAVTADSLDVADATDAAEGRLRVARHASLMMDLDLASSPPPALERRASAVHRPGAAPLGNPDAVTTRWFGLLPCPFAPPAIDRIEPAARERLERRHGWHGQLAMTVIELAQHERVAPSILQHRLIEAVARLSAC